MPKSQKKKNNAKKKKVIKPVLKVVEEAIPAEIIFGIEGSEFAEDLTTDVSGEMSSIISIVRGLEGQVETAFKLKGALETELDATQQKLSEEMETRKQLEVQVGSLQTQTVLAEQLRQDISFAEDERNKFADELTQTQQELGQVASERNSLIEQFSNSEANIKDLESDKLALEAQIMNLKDNITDADLLHKELAEIAQTNRQSREQTHDLTRRLETAEASKSALETQLTGAHKNAQGLRIETEQLRRKLADKESRTADLRVQLEGQQATNQELVENNHRLENEISMTNNACETAKNELNSFTSALRDIRSEATRTSGRVRQKYFKPKNTVSSSQMINNNNSQSHLQPFSTKV